MFAVKIRVTKWQQTRLNGKRTIKNIDYFIQKTLPPNYLPQLQQQQEIIKIKKTT